MRPDMKHSLPLLREELSIVPGPVLADGQPSWTLHDPVRNLFFQIDWPGFEILSRWPLAKPEQIIAEVNAETTLDIGFDDLERMLAFLRDNQLLQPASGSAASMAGMLKKRRGTWKEWLLHHYLFLRIPLVRPDRWLSAWAPRLDFLFSRMFFQLTLGAALLGLASVYRDWERFSSTLVDMLTWQGMLAYGVTLVVVKILHELGHGLTAKRFGCRVPTMGIALLVLWPVAYTDTNEVWKLNRRDQRLKVAGAGIATELSIAAWATLAWSWLPEGLPKSVAFLLSTTTWVSTVVINASPFMRFDGYFLLSDYLQLPNLHGRAFALARWDLRERLFALREPPPERFARRLHNGLILFAWATWIYRLVVFLGIAVLVYHFFIKAVGIFLFLVEIGWFVLRPLRHELNEWRERWPALRSNRRARRSAALGLLLFVTFLLPLPTRVTASALLQPRDQFVLYAPPHAAIAGLPVKDGQAVEAGAPLMHMTSPDLGLRGRQAKARQERYSLQSAAAGFDPELRKNWQVLNEQLVAANAEQSTVEADGRRYTPAAPYKGILQDIDPDLRAGQWVGDGELLGRLVADGPWQVVTYVDEDEIHRIALGDRALFIADGLAGPDFRLEVAGIDRDASRTLNEPELAAPFGGHVLIREKNGLLYPERAVYRVLLRVKSEQPVTRHSWRGEVTIAGRWEAPGIRFLRTAMAVLWREAGF